MSVRFSALALALVSACRCGGPPEGHVPPSSVDAGIAIAKPCPEEMAFVPVDAGVCVDLYEAALVQRSATGAESAWPFYENVEALDGGTVRAVPAHGIYPQGYISQVQAKDACARSGKRLCTRAEWTAACRGRPAHDYIYPYGDTYDGAACNEGRASPMTPTSSLQDPHNDQRTAGLARGGDYPKCKSAYGAFDMHGNLHEWVDDSSSDSTGTFMGGYFVDATANGRGCEYATTAHAKTYRDYSTGFRCCADPIRP